MNRPMHDDVPPEMPKDLDRVYAALGAPPEAPPEGLLGEILASRAAGERRILPVDHARSSRLRVQLLRGAVAAALGLLALGILSRMGRPDATPTSPSVAGFGFPMGGDFGIGELALAQGNQEPRFAPMTFDTARLRAARLQYVRRSYENGNSDGADTLAYTFSRAPGADHQWIVVTTRTMGESRDRAYMTDTIRLAGATLDVQSEVYRVEFPDGRPYVARWTFNDRTVHFHTEMQTERHAAVGTGAASDSVAASASKRSRSADHPIVDTRKNAAVVDHSRDTTIVQDTVFALPASKYPRLASSMSYGGEPFLRLMAVPLSPGWKRGAMLTIPGGVLVREGVRRSAIPIDIELVGSERIASWRGSVDCWKLVSHGTAAEVTYLVRKGDGVVASRTVTGTSGGKSFKSEMVLIGEQ